MRRLYLIILISQLASGIVYSQGGILQRGYVTLEGWKAEMVAQDIVRSVHLALLVKSLEDKIDNFKRRGSVTDSLVSAYREQVRVLDRRDSLRLVMLDTRNSLLLISREEVRYLKRRRLRGTLISVGGVVASFLIGKFIK